MSELFDNLETPAVTPAEAKPTATETPATPTVPSFDDHLKSIVTSDGRQKYNDVPTALDGLKNAQDHIATLTTQLAEAKAKVDEAKGVDDVLEQLRQANQPAPTPTSVPAGISQEDVLKLVNQTLTQKQIEEKHAQNASALRASLKETFGDDAKAAEAFNAKAVELGMSSEELTTIAVSNPKLILAHFNKTKVPTADATVPTINFGQLPDTPADKLAPVPLGATNDDLVASYRLHAPKT